ncbi:ferredoxin [Micromonospora sp. DT233]|uniref:ferredoxin n=1 Tax=Micromonospora sp. DT233 TaxID=3393432 RepID=UPI003CEC3651
MRIRVDEKLCTGHGMCAAMAPGIYQINEDTAFNEMGEFTVPEEARAIALRGLSACPEKAISFVDEHQEANR